MLAIHGGIAAEADPLRSPLVGFSMENRGPMHVTVWQLLPSFVMGRVIGVGEEYARAAKCQNTRRRLWRGSITVLAGCGVVVKGRGRRVDLLGLASSLERSRPPSRPAGAARGATQVTDIGDQVGHTSQMHAVLAYGPRKQCFGTNGARR